MTNDAKNLIKRLGNIPEEEFFKSFETVSDFKASVLVLNGLLETMDKLRKQLLNDLNPVKSNRSITSANFIKDKEPPYISIFKSGETYTTTEAAQVWSCKPGTARQRIYYLERHGMIVLVGRKRTEKHFGGVSVANAYKLAVKPETPTVLTYMELKKTPQGEKEE